MVSTSSSALKPPPAPPRHATPRHADVDDTRMMDRAPLYLRTARGHVARPHTAPRVRAAGSTILARGQSGSRLRVACHARADASHSIGQPSLTVSCLVRGRSGGNGLAEWEMSAAHCHVPARDAILHPSLIACARVVCRSVTQGKSECLCALLAV